MKGIERSYVFGPFGTVVWAGAAGWSLAKEDWVNFGILTALVLAATWFIDKALNPSATITFGWRCHECEKFEVESTDEDLLERVKLDHIERHHAS